MKWPKEDEALLLELSNKGVYPSEIISRIRFKTGRTYTRNAIIGKMDRMGIKRKPKNPDLPMGPDLSYKKDKVFNTPLDDSKAFIDLKNHECRWKVSEEEDLWCAHGVEKDKPYCSYHASRAYTAYSHVPKSWLRT